MQEVGYVVIKQAKLPATKELTNISGLAGDHVVDTGDLRAGVDQPSTYVRSKKAGAAQDHGVLTFHCREGSKVVGAGES
jgi:hypothetical protein